MGNRIAAPSASRNSRCENVSDCNVGRTGLQEGTEARYVQTRRGNDPLNARGQESKQSECSENPTPTDQAVALSCPENSGTSTPGLRSRIAPDF